MEKHKADFDQFSIYGEENGTTNAESDSMLCYSVRPAHAKFCRECLCISKQMAMG